MFENDDDPFPVKCQGCGEEFYEKIGRIKAGLDSRYPRCQLRLTHPAEQFRRVLENINGARPDYFGRFVRLQMPK